MNKKKKLDSQINNELILKSNSPTIFEPSQLDELQKQKRAVCEMAARSILHALDLKDSYTYGHSARVAFYSIELGKQIQLNSDELYELELSALFHDIGKIGIPDGILLKPDRLNDEEFQIMRKHPEMSSEILEGFEPFKNVAKYARHHHERFDGRGYPSKLKGDEIPLFSRIILIADTFDAMTSSRTYRKGLSYEIAFRELLEFSGSQFDPYLVPEFIKAMRKEKRRNEKTFTLKILNQEFKKEAA